MQYDLMQARVAELHRQADCDRLVQAAIHARRPGKPRQRSRRPITRLARRVLTLRGARTAAAR